MKCPNCGKKIDRDDRFCISCGAAVNQETPKKKKSGKGKIVAVIALICVVLIAGVGFGTFKMGLWGLDDIIATNSENESAEYTVNEDYITTYDDGDTVYSQGEENLAIDEDTYIIYYDNLLTVFTFTDLSESDANALADEVGGTVVGDISGCINLLQILVPSTDLETLEGYADTLMESENVLYASYDIPIELSEEDDNPWSDDGTEISGKGDESDPDGNDWWAEAIGAYTAWDIVDNNPDWVEDITVGILDSGFDTDHEDLAEHISVINENSEEKNSHGTHVAGIIGALNNNVGIRGIADNASLLCADWKITDSNGEKVSLFNNGEWITLTKQLIEDGVKVINNSWGSEYSYLEKLYTDMSHNSIDTAIFMASMEKSAQGTASIIVYMMYSLYLNGYLGDSTDVIFVQAAGNGYSNLGLVGFNATYNGYYCSVTEERFRIALGTVIFDTDDTGLITLSKIDDAFDYEFVKEHIVIVGAVSNKINDEGYYKMTKTNYGDVIDICAPGSDIYSTISDDGYEAKGGTSMAAPMVSGAAALVWSLNPELTAGEVKSILISTAGRAVGTNSDDTREEYPMLNVGNAVIQTVMGSITGIIVDSKTGEAISDVSVTISTNASSGDEFNYSSSNSASDCSFKVSAVGSCTLTLEKEGYETKEITVGVDMRQEVDLGEISMKAMGEDSSEDVEQPAEEEISYADFFDEYINDVLIPEYGILESGATTEMSCDEDYKGIWLNSGIMSITIADLDGDGEDECMVFILIRDEESEGDNVALSASVYEIVEGEVTRSDIIYLDEIYDSDWFLHSWNGSLVEVDGCLYFIFEYCEWPNTRYALEIYMSVRSSVEEAYSVYAYADGELEKVHSFDRVVNGEEGSVFYEHVYEDDDVTEEALYTTLNNEYMNLDVVTYSTYIDAIEYFANIYDLSVNEDIMTDSGRYLSSESIFLDSDNLTRLFAHSILAEGDESPYVYEQTATTTVQYSQDDDDIYEDDESPEENETTEEDDAETRDILIQYINDVLIPEYGIVEYEQSISLYDETWFDYSGLFAASILDLDGDGNDELLISRAKEESDDEYAMLMEVYEEKDGSVTLADDAMLVVYDGSDYGSSCSSYYGFSNVMSVFALSAVLMDDGYYLVGEEAGNADTVGSRDEAIWVMEYKDETLQYVYSWEPYTFDWSFQYSYAYGFEDGVNTDLTIYYNPNGEEVDVDDLEDMNAELVVYETGDEYELLREYGLIFEYEDGKKYLISGSTANDSESELVFCFTMVVDYITELSADMAITCGNDLLD